MIRTRTMSDQQKTAPRKLFGSAASQQGMASIVITMVTMVVISLIVLGFATISRREARQTLDQSQSTQAFYAAESGVEDVRKAIKTQMAAGLPVQAKNSCTTNDGGATFATGAAYPVGDAMTVDATNNTAYTCLQVDPTPESLEFDGVNSDSTVVPLTAASGTIRRVEVVWRPNTTTGSPSVCPATITDQFTPQSSWACAYGVMRVDVSPTDATMTRASLASASYGAYFQPVNYSSPGTDSYSGNTNTPRLVAANCDTTSYKTCKAVIDQLPGLTSLSLRISSIYQPSSVQITAYDNNGVAGSPVRITGVQAEIDATGKATDVLRRIKVRLPLLNSATLVPSSAITSNGSICKRFETATGYVNFPASMASVDTSNSMCQSRPPDGTLPGTP